MLYLSATGRLSGGRAPIVRSARLWYKASDRSEELGENMTPDESALAVLIEEADWGALLSRMDGRFTGEVVIEEWVQEHLTEVEKLADDQSVVETVPEELSLTEQSE